ncbi:PDZ domain-containing protein GIPC3-like [Acanthaster planci]|uniref:PDZ domain-containing protein GIPC3-like n=1 Tax=Acanthaster planci TaxID=133434 RepID=A0A8B7Y4T3_ACAPL|nr:PDZ domain-containing protein GIPC3-like [Acanthaster planci]
MPLFPKKKGEKKPKGGLTEYEQQPDVDQTNSREAYPTAPTSAVPPVANGSQVPSATQPQQPPRRLVFYTQLAHGSSTERIEGFTNVRELYEEIAKAFDIAPLDILFCTLNTHKVDMERLLGGQIGLEDLIVAHVKGPTKAIECLKSDASLGLTITDNGAGYAFIKRIKENSVMEGVAEVLVGDHIEAINGKSMIGSRHFEVAKEFKDLPVGLNFTVNLVEPKKAFTKIAPRSATPVMAPPVAATPTENQVKTGRETLRLHSKGPAEIVKEEPNKFETIAATKCDDLLESYIGIRDETLAETLVGLFKGKSDFSDFMAAVEEQLGELEFPEEFIFDLWGMMGDVKDGRI